MLGAHPWVRKVVAASLPKANFAVGGGGVMCAGYVTKGAVYRFHSAARMPNDPLRAATSVARPVSLARAGAQVRDCTVASAAGCHAPAGRSASG